MRVVTADEIDGLLTFPDLVNALREAFAAEFVTPPRQQAPVEPRRQPEHTEAKPAPKPQARPEQPKEHPDQREHHQP